MARKGVKWRAFRVPLPGSTYFIVDYRWDVGLFLCDGERLALREIRRAVFFPTLDDAVTFMTAGQYVTWPVPDTTKMVPIRHPNIDRAWRDVTKAAQKLAIAAGQK